MKYADFFKTWDGAQAENKLHRLSNVSLIIVVALLVGLLMGKEETVILKPVTLGSDAWITKSKSSESYKEAWGLFFAQMTGNITPDNVGFFKERLKPMLSPQIYIEVIDTIELQAKDIEDDRITMRFEPRLVEYEDTSDKVFVYGYSFVKGSDGVEDRKERTYEYRLKIDNYAPMIVDLNTYEGKPRSERVLLQIEKLEQSRRKKNAQA